MNLEKYIRNVPDFPKAGVGFKDITPLLNDAAACRQAVEQMCAPFRNAGIDKVAGIEARGFIFGCAAALELGAGFVPVRKPGKLPADVIRQEYTLEYGCDAVEMHRDSIAPGERVLLVDDLLATGGTMAAAAGLVHRLGGETAGTVFLIELAFLNGRQKLGSLPVYSLITYEQE